MGMKYIVLAALLGANPVMAAEPQRMTCIAVELDTVDPAIPDPTDHGLMAVLDMQGRWVVSSWTDIEWLALSSRDHLQKCVAQELMAIRSSVSKNVTPDLNCPPPRNKDGALSMWAWGATQRVIDNDPIMRACQPINRCNFGDTCS